MIEKVNPAHPDKVADRIAGAIVDYCYTKQENPKVAVEVLIGHGLCTIIAETYVKLTEKSVKPIIERIVGEEIKVKLVSVNQDEHLASNQENEIRCGDNGIFKGEPLTDEEMELTRIAQEIYLKYPTDGKYILDGNKLIVCQSNCDSNELLKELTENYPEYDITVNPLGDWTGGTNVDAGATNRKLGSDMGHSVTGGGLHGKDISKGDLSINVYAWLKAQETGRTKQFSCAIGDTEIDGEPYSEIVKIAKEYVDSIGGFEEFACWGLW